MKNNDTVILTLDRPRELHFRHKEMKRLQAMFHIDPDSVDNISDAETVEKVMFIMLERDAREHGEDLKIEEMEDLLDMAPRYGSVIDAMMRRLTLSFAPDDDPDATAEETGGDPTTPAH